jgi:DNA-binding PadR family transcriptional regulator
MDVGESMSTRDVILSLLAKEPAHGYELRQRLAQALGPAGGALNPGQVYVTLSRLERAGLVEAREVAQPSQPDKKVYELTASGLERVMDWFNDLTWSKVAPLEFHLKLVAAAATRLTDPVALVDSQRLELLRELRQLQELALRESPDSDGALLLEGASLRLQADIRWLEVCQQRIVEREAR